MHCIWVAREINISLHDETKPYEIVKRIMRFISVSTGILFLITLHLEARTMPGPEVSGKGSLQSLVHSGVLPPLWFVALQEGRWDNLGGNQILATVASELEWQVTRAFSLEAMAEIDHSGGLGETCLHTGWVGATWKNLTFKAGKHVFDPIFPENNVGSGSYLFGRNYRPVSRISLQMPAYTKVPLTNGRVEVRGGISQGWLNEQPANGDVLLHEKYAYMRWNGGALKPYLGLNHSSIFGGHWKETEEKIPVDFWATFRAGGSQKIGRGEATNAAGAHMGLYDFGVYANTTVGTVHFYYQIPFSDGSGMRFWERNRDRISGVTWQPGNIAWLNSLTVEWMQTTYQSGNGMPDPKMEIDGIRKIIFAGEVDRNAFVMEHFGIESEDFLSREAFLAILEDEINHGNKFGGRDGYMNNGMYTDGWSRKDHIMGNPFHLTRGQLLAARPGMEFHHDVKIKNDRFNAFHAGATGRFNTEFTWETKISFTRNHGTYFEQYDGRYTWDEVDNYWFKNGRDQWYTMLSIGWHPMPGKGIMVKGGIALDAGEIYQSSGFNLSIIYQPF